MTLTVNIDYIDPSADHSTQFPLAEMLYAHAPGLPRSDPCSLQLLRIAVPAQPCHPMHHQARATFKCIQIHPHLTPSLLLTDAGSIIRVDPFTLLIAQVRFLAILIPYATRTCAVPRIRIYA